jgi:hypothetical protein
MFAYIYCSMKNGVLAFSIGSVLLTSFIIVGTFKTGIVAALAATSTSATSTDAEVATATGYRKLDTFLDRVEPGRGGGYRFNDGDINNGRAPHRQRDIYRLIRNFFR